MNPLTTSTVVGAVVNFRGLNIPAVVVSAERDGRFLTVGMRRLRDDGTPNTHTQYDHISIEG